MGLEPSVPLARIAAAKPVGRSAAAMQIDGVSLNWKGRRPKSLGTDFRAELGPKERARMTVTSKQSRGRAGRPLWL